MKKLISSFAGWIYSVFFLLFILVSLTVNSAWAQSDTLYPSGVFGPAYFSGYSEINEPLQEGRPAGDINNDRLEDFVFTKYTQSGYNTILVTDVKHPGESVVLQDACLAGIGDFNGDKYDDLLDTQKWVVYLGNESATDFEIIELNMPGEDNCFETSLDIDGDGNNEIIVGKVISGTSNIDLYAISYTNSEPIPINLDFELLTSSTKLLFNKYDYDNDGESELFIAVYSRISARYEYGWFVYDTLKNMYDYEEANYVYTNQFPADDFTIALSDVNGDGLKDICFDYYVSEEGFYLEVCPGSETKPWFDEPFDVPIGIKNRLILPAGDIDGDGADDWYTKNDPDSVLLLYGNGNIDSSGFIRNTVFAGKYQFFYPVHTKGISYKPPKDIPVFDYDNDGKDDLLFNYWSFDDNYRYDMMGMAIVKGGSVIDFSKPEVLGLEASKCNFTTGFGNKVKNAGDLNNDGFPDWAVVSLLNNRVDIYYGGDPLDFEPDVSILLPQYPFVQTRDVAFGDLNNDGLLDIVVSNSTFQQSVYVYMELIETRQHVYIFNGKENLPQYLYADYAAYTLEADTLFTENLLGNTISIPGDYNADGFDDLIMKSNFPYKVNVYYGGTELSTEPDEIINEYTSNYFFADPIIACGDINNDGYSDFFLDDQAAYPEMGNVFGYFGGPDADDQSDVVLGEVSGEHFSVGVAAHEEGDFNNDGFPDLAVCMNENHNIAVYLGGEDFDSEPDLFLSDTAISKNITVMDFVPDFSEKGKSDVLFNQWNYSGPFDLYMYYGSDDDKTETDLLIKNDLQMVNSVASGDFNQNGYRDLFVGVPFAVNEDGMKSGLVQYYESPFVTAVEQNRSNDVCTLSVVPNPATDAVHVTFSTSKAQKITVTLNSMDGRVLKTYRSESNHTEILNLSGLSKGVYTLTVQAGSKKVTEKLIKR